MECLQALGEEVCVEEKQLVEDHKKGRIKGEKRSPSTVWGSGRRICKTAGERQENSRQGKAEVKIGIAYDSWKHTGKERYELPDKVVAAGFEGAEEFHEYREAAIAGKYNLDEVNERILNADGASWIKKVKDKSTRFQLDPFHRSKAVREKIHNEKAVRNVMGLLKEEKMGGLFDYLKAYRDSLGNGRETGDVEELIRYYRDNEEGLLPYQSRGLELPGHPEGLEYRNIGTMENHVWSVIARRMKHNHRSWSLHGGNHLAKILAKKCSGKLYEVTEKLKRPVGEEEKAEELYGDILLSVKAPKKDRKGYEYPVIGHMGGLEGAVRGDHKKLLTMAGF